MARRLRLRLEKRLQGLERAASDFGATNGRQFPRELEPGEMESVLASLIESIGREQVREMLPDNLHDSLQPMLD
jgi:hypothetical protein